MPPPTQPIRTPRPPPGYDRKATETSLVMSHYSLRYLHFIFRHFEGDIALAIVLGEIAHHNLTRHFASGTATRDFAHSFFLEPAPGVRRAVFMSTPHHGTRTARSLVSRIVRPLLDLPGDLTQVALSFQQDSAVRLPPKLRRRIPTSLDDMSPSNPWLLALADLPVAPGIAANSIIGIKDDTPPPGGTDGVVTYASAHVEPVESELVVRGKHGLPRNRAAIAEIRRILHEHLAAIAATPATHPAPPQHAAN